MRYAKLGLLSLVTCLLPVSAYAQVKLPYFKAISAGTVCGGYSSRCQPNSSSQNKGFTGADLNALEEWLGAYSPNGYKDRSSCDQQFTQDEIWTNGGNTFSGQLESKYKASLRAKLAANITQYLSGLMVILPPNLQSKLNADATDRIATDSTISAKFVYKRYDLKMPAIQRLMKACVSAPKGRKFITGVSVVTMSGDWAKSRIIDSLGEIEKTAEFMGLNEETKLKYTDQRKNVFAGSFEPMSLVIGTSWRAF